MVSLATGTVLEIGVGSGANFPHYDRTAVKHLYAFEPNPGMLRLALMQRHRASIEIEFLTQSGERIPVEDGARLRHEQRRNTRDAEGQQRNDDADGETSHATQF
jgi:Methyltransferase domain